VKVTSLHAEGAVYQRVLLVLVQHHSHCAGLELLLTAALLLVAARAVPEGARGAGGGMPAAPLSRDCAAAEAAAATAAAALARSASARAVCCAFAAF